MVRISEAISRMADGARLAGRPSPVIVTDVLSAAILRDAIERDLGALADIRHPGTMGRYDGVAILHPGETLPRGWPNSSTAWHEHFGALADAYSEAVDAV